MQNFGKIKNVFNGILVEGIISKDDSAKKLFKRYIKSIKENEILKTQFLVYNNIENKYEYDAISAGVFVSENIKLLEKFNQKDILAENKKLIDMLGKYQSRLDDKTDLSELHESISKLILTKRQAGTINAITENLKVVSRYIQTEKTKNVVESIDLPVSVLAKIMVEKYNQKYSNLNESDKTVLKKLIGSSFEEKKNMYFTYVNECVGLIDNLLTDSSNPNDKLFSVKSKLLEDVVITEDNFIEKITKIIDLKENLKQ